MTNLSDGVCAGTMGPFEYLHGWAQSLQYTWSGLLTILAHQDLAETELIEALLSDTVQGLPSAETLWIQQFGIYGECSTVSSRLKWRLFVLIRLRKFQ